MRKARALRLFLECVSELRSEIGRRAVIVWFTGGGFGNAGVVEFGELDQVFVSFAVRSILEGLLNGFAYVDRPLDFLPKTAPRH